MTTGAGSEPKARTPVLVRPLKAFRLEAFLTYRGLKSNISTRYVIGLGSSQRRNALAGGFHGFDNPLHHLIQ